MLRVKIKSDWRKSVQNLQQEELPVYERLGDVRELVVCRTKLAIMLLQRGRGEDAQSAIEHLLWSFEAARQRGLAETQQIAAILQQLLPQSELPVSPKDGG